MDNSFFLYMLLFDSAGLLAGKLNKYVQAMANSDRKRSGKERDYQAHLGSLMEKAEP